MNSNKFTPPMWKIHPVKTDMGEFIIGKSIHDDRQAEVVCMGILNPYDAQLISVAPNMFYILKCILEIINTNPEKIVNLKESIESMLNYINYERIDKNE